MASPLRTTHLARLSRNRREAQYIRKAKATMAAIMLTDLQRLNLHGIVMGKRYDDDDDAEAFNAFGKQIILDKLFRRTLYHDLPNGDRVNNPTALEKLEEDERTTPFEIESLLASKLLTRIKEWRDKEKLSPKDTDWYKPLKTQLETIASLVSKNGTKRPSIPPHPEVG